MSVLESSWTTSKTKDQNGEVSPAKKFTGQNHDTIIAKFLSIFIDGKEIK